MRRPSHRCWPTKQSCPLSCWPVHRHKIAVSSFFVSFEALRSGFAPSSTTDSLAGLQPPVARDVFGQVCHVHQTFSAVVAHRRRELGDAASRAGVCFLPGKCIRGVPRSAVALAVLSSRYIETGWGAIVGNRTETCGERAREDPGRFGASSSFHSIQHVRRLQGLFAPHPYIQVMNWLHTLLPSVCDEMIFMVTWGSTSCRMCRARLTRLEACMPAIVARYLRSSGLGGKHELARKPISWPNRSV